MITLNKSFFTKIGRLLVHPISMLIFGGLISWFFYIKSYSDKQPYYSISNPSLIATSNGAEDLQIFWKGNQFENVKNIKLIIWNNGREYIDTDDFVKSTPIQLINDGNIKILSIEQEHSSRSNILFSSTITGNDTVSYAIFNLMRDEALEYKDGAIFNILYTDINQGDWHLNGRIKGVPGGFQKVSFSDITKPKKMTSFYFLGIALLIVICFRIVVLKMKNKPVVFRQWELVFMSLIIVQFFYVFIETTFLSVSLEWIRQ